MSQGSSVLERKGLGQISDGLFKPLTKRIGIEARILSLNLLRYQNLSLLFSFFEEMKMLTIFVLQDLNLPSSKDTFPIDLSK